MNIEIDFDVYKALTARRISEETTYNDVLREMLGLPQTEQVMPGSSSPTAGDDWVVKSIRFPAGTEFRAEYKGTTYAAVAKSGRLMLNGKSFKTPSAAAMSITGNNVNGWDFWECRFPGQTRWKVMTALRHQ